MKYVSSKENKIYKSAIKLMKKKFRDDSGMYLLEGVKPLKDALQMGISVETVFACEDKIEMAEELFASECHQMIGLPRELFSELSDTETSQGIISVVHKVSYSPSEFAERIGQGSNVIVLDRLQDPGNVGTIIRTAEAAGYGGIVVMKGSSDIYSPKVVRAAAGSLFRMPVVTGWDVSQLQEFVDNQGMKITVTCLENATNCYDADLREYIALVIGNEGQGVCADIMDIADVRVTIPMAGAIESLNAAVAAAILMYQPYRR